ncbi:ROK family protein [Collinsella intestinalis]|uniref:ROK family protein n=1 Tax=Collinsella intestinalis TaxID=147207 RepID=UPI001959ABF8|nr:ROK family protein [Collinsella intestinalis]MBM6908029.1 ROK family protein [Collinsella intestinalis]
MADDIKLYIGIDVGGTSVKEGLFNENGELLGKISVPTPPLTDEAGFNAVISGIDQLVAGTDATAAAVKGVGLAVPCPVPSSGEITLAANIEIDPPALKAALEGHCPEAAVRYVNDANAAAMGELWRGSAQGRDSMVMVTIGTGLGGGVVVNGDVIGGAFGAGGEIGHITVNPDETETCGCGRRGCLEQYASASGVVTNYLRACKAHGVEPHELSGSSDSRTVFQLCREGDEVALEAMETMTDYLSLGLTTISAVVDPEIYVLGGGASASSDVYLETLRKKFADRALKVSKDTPIEVATLGNDAGIIGAAYVALRASREA